MPTGPSDPERGGEVNGHIRGASRRRTPRYRGAPDVVTSSAAPLSILAALRGLLGRFRRSGSSDEGLTFRQAWLRSAPPPAITLEERLDALRQAVEGPFGEGRDERMASMLLHVLLQSPDGHLLGMVTSLDTNVLLAALESGSSDVAGRLLAAVRLGGPAGDAVRGRLYSTYRLAGGDVRLAAAVALACSGDPRVVDGLIEGLEHAHADARLTSAYALGMLGAAAAGSGDALTALAECERDKDVRRAAVVAVGLIARAVRAGPVELLSAAAPAGRGNEPEAVSLPGRGTEPEAVSQPGRGTEPEAGAAGRGTESMGE